MRRLSALVAVLFVATGAVAAQTPLQVDLAQDMTGSSTQIPSGGTYYIRVTNHLLRYRYVVNYVVEDQAIGPLEWPAGSAPSGPTRSNVRRNVPAAGCDTVSQKKLSGYLDDFTKLQEETGLPTKISNVEKDLKDNGPAYAGCVLQVDSLTGLLQNLHTPLVRVIDQSVGNGRSVIVTVTRFGKDTSEFRSWTKTFVGRPRGAWLTTYGFSFVTDWIAHSETFTTKSVDSTGKYVIVKDADQDHFHFVPTVFFSWLPYRPNNNLSFVASGGLGFDLTNPVILAGLGLNWNQNLTLHLGMAAAKVDRLLGHYAPGDTVGTNLTPDQLKQSVYRFNPFVSLSFNFSSNPFGSGGNTKGSTGGTTAQPAK